MSGLPAFSGPVVYVDDLDGLVVDPDDVHHLQRVLRLRPGAEFAACDGRGNWRVCRFGPTIDIAGDVVAEPAPAHRIGIAMSMVKGDRIDWAIQKMTELGVDDIHLTAMERSVVEWPQPKIARNIARLERIARAASAQSKRAWLPQLHGVVAFSDAVSLPHAVRADPAGGPPHLGYRNVLIGPEGGWSEAERAAPLPTLALGPQVLRVETAAVAAATLLVALRHHLVVPPPNAVENADCG